MSNEFPYRFLSFLTIQDAGLCGGQNSNFAGCLVRLTGCCESFSSRNGCGEGLGRLSSLGFSVALRARTTYLSRSRGFALTQISLIDCWATILSRDRLVKPIYQLFLHLCCWVGRLLFLGIAAAQLLKLYLQRGWLPVLLRCPLVLVSWISCTRCGLHFLHGIYLCIWRRHRLRSGILLGDCRFRLLSFDRRH